MSSRAPQGFQQRLQRRQLRVESLEDRSLLSATPLPSDSAGGAGGVVVISGTTFDSVPIIEIKPGDANGDDVVDFHDLQIWSDHFMQPANLAYLEGDFNLDGFTDGADYTIWADNFALVAPPSAAAVATVPAAAAIPAGAFANGQSVDAAVLTILSGAATLADSETAAANPIKADSSSTQGLSDCRDEFEQTAGVAAIANIAEEESPDLSSLIDSAEALQLAAIGQSWESAANDGSTCGKLGNSRK